MPPADEQELVALVAPKAHAIVEELTRDAILKDANRDELATRILQLAVFSAANARRIAHIAINGRG